MAYVHPPASPPIPAKASGPAVAALIVGIVAFLFGLVPFVGLLVATVGIVLGIVALGRPGTKAQPIIGLVLSGIAMLTSIVAIIVFFAFTNLPSIWSSDGIQFDGQSNASQLTLTSVTTPCFTFEGPREFLNNQQSAEDELCFTTLQGWGELNADGTIAYSNVGLIWDKVIVEPLRVESTDTWAPDGELDSMVNYLETNYFPQSGEVISLREPITLDGQEANITRIDSAAETTETKATLVVKAPQPYDTANGPVQFFLITFVVVDERGDLIIDALVDSWRWK